MKLETAIKVLREDQKFLGFKTLDNYVAAVRRSPLAFPNKVIDAYKVFDRAANDVANEYTRKYGD
jgi:hypothetical protein